MPQQNYISTLFAGLNKPGNLKPTYSPAPNPVGPMSLAPKKIATPLGNSGATNPTLSTPAAKQFVSSQISTAPTGAPNQNVPAGAGTPGYTYVNGQLTSVGGKPTSTVSQPTTTTPPPITGATTTPSGATVDATTGSLITPPTPAPADPNAAYTGAFDQYLKSLQPSSTQTAASKYLSDLQLQAQKDQEDALNSGETQGFATGEAARVNRNNSFAIDAASNTVNALNGQETANTNAAKAGLDFQKSLLPAPGSDFNLSPGQTRYDPKGNTIATAPETATAPKIIGDSSSGYYTVGDDGKLTQLLGATPKTLNTSQNQAQGYALINQLLGMTDSSGVPYVDPNGYFTPQGFKSIVQNAAEDGLSRADILAEYGDKIYPQAADKYGLTPKEKTDLGIS